MLQTEQYPLQRNTEIVVLMDSSKGVTPDTYQIQKAFVKALVRSFTLSSKGPKGNVLMYAQFAYIITELRSPDVYNRINSATLLGKPRRIDTALQQTAALLTRSKRTGRKIVVLLIAGNQTTGTESFTEAIKPLRRLQVQTFVVSVGQQMGTKVLKPLVDRLQDIFVIQQPANLLSKVGPIAKAIRDKPGTNCTY